MSCAVLSCSKMSTKVINVHFDSEKDDIWIFNINLYALIIHKANVLLITDINARM